MQKQTIKMPSLPSLLVLVAIASVLALVAAAGTYGAPINHAPIADNSSIS